MERVGDLRVAEAKSGLTTARYAKVHANGSRHQRNGSEAGNLPAKINVLEPSVAGKALVKAQVPCSDRLQTETHVATVGIVHRVQHRASDRRRHLRGSVRLG